MKTNRLAALGGVAALAAVIAGGALLTNAPSVTAAPAPDPSTAPAPTADAKNYAIDAVHSSVIFKVKHLNTANFYGRFNKLSGTFALGDTASVDVTVDANSVDSNNAGRDKHIKSPDFFSAAEFPDIKFKAANLAKSGDGSWKGKGDLTFRGVTKSIELTITQTGSGKGQSGGEIAGIESSITIKRSDFGSKGLIGPVSDEVTLWFAAEGGAK